MRSSTEHSDIRGTIARHGKRSLLGVLLAVGAMLTSPAWGAGPAPVNLRSAGNFTILAGAGISSTGGGIVNGDVGASPITGAAIGLNANQVNGIIYAVDGSGPAGSVVDASRLSTAKGDLTTAMNDAAGRTPVPSGPNLNPGSGNLGGLNLAPGLYKFTGTALITGSDLTLTGGLNDVWIFQIAADLQVGSGIKVILAGSAQAKNIFWQVGTSAVLGTSSVFKGTIMAEQSVVMMTSSSVEGRALAFSSGITFDGTRISSGSPWDGSIHLGNNWHWLSWFGYYYDTGTGWIYHRHLGWLYTSSLTAGSVWLWTPADGWFWTSASYFSYLYENNTGHWLWYQPESNSPRWFYNLTTGTWESF